MPLKIIREDSIYLHPNIKNREELFDFAAKKALKKQLINKIEDFTAGLIERENQGTTELKPGIAIPHVKKDMINKIFVFLIILKKGIKFSPGFSKGVDIFFLIGAPKMEKKYINVLGSIARLIDKDNIMQEFRKANVKEDVIYTIQKHTISEKKLEQGKTKYQITLSLNINFSIKTILAIFLELDIHQPILFEGENLSSKNNFGLSFFGLSAIDVKSQLTHNKTLIGITEDKDAAIKLNELLKEEGIDLNTPGTGSLYSTELKSSFGGISPDIDF